MPYGLRRLLPRPGLELTQQVLPEVVREESYSDLEPYLPPSFIPEHFQQQPYIYSHPAYDPLTGDGKVDGIKHIAPWRTYPHRTRNESTVVKSITSRTVCGCSFIAFVLSCIIALLMAASIGLGTTVGIESRRASDVRATISQLRTYMVNSTSNPTSMTTESIDDGCGSNPTGIDRSVYMAFSRMLQIPRLC